MRFRTISFAVAALAWATVGAAAPGEPDAASAKAEGSSPKVQPTPTRAADPRAKTIESLGGIGAAPGIAPELTIDRSVLERLERREPAEDPPRPDAVERTYASFKQALQDLAGKTASYRAKLRECAAQRYSAREQQLAGCRGDDTVDECAEKLLDFCSNNDLVAVFGARRVLAGHARELQVVVERVTRRVDGR